MNTIGQKLLRRQVQPLCYLLLMLVLSQIANLSSLSTGTCIVIFNVQEAGSAYDFMTLLCMMRSVSHFGLFQIFCS